MTPLQNERLLRLLSVFLNERADCIRKEDVAEIASCGIPKEQAYSLLLAAQMGLLVDENQEDAALYRTCFPKMLQRLDTRDYPLDVFPMTRKQVGNWLLAPYTVKAYELFVRDDFIPLGNGLALPQLGYFEQDFSCPAVYENGRLWMSVTPNEINTMKEPIEKAFGNVLVNGLGLGYYAHMVSMKNNVSHVTVIERDENVIALFERELLPRFPQRHKITVVRDDAFAYADTHLQEGHFDTVFTDLWHDVSDGIPLWHEMRKRERLSPASRFFYWIEKTMRCYEL